MRLEEDPPTRGNVGPAGVIGVVDVILKALLKITTVSWFVAISPSNLITGEGSHIHRETLDGLAWPKRGEKQA